MTYYGESEYDGVLFASIDKFRVLQINLVTEKATIVKDYVFLKDAIEHADDENRKRKREGDIFLVFDDDGKCRYANEKICNVEGKYAKVTKKFMSIK